MKIGIISDTHDHLDRVKDALEKFKRAGVERILHAGDLCSPFVVRAFKEGGIPMISVFGNNDGDVLLLSRMLEGGGEIGKGPRELELAGRRIALMHEPVFLEALADSGRFDLVIYGHTHQLEERRQGKALIVNPGEACGWLKGRGTALVCELEEMKVEKIVLE